MKFRKGFSSDPCKVVDLDTGDKVINGEKEEAGGVNVREEGVDF